MQRQSGQSRQVARGGDYLQFSSCGVIQIEANEPDADPMNFLP
jgi:hypothetical protein